MTPEEESFVNQMQLDMQNTQAVASQAQQGMATMFNRDQDSNLVKWQLDIAEELERIEHLLRKHIPRMDKQGNEYFEEPKKEDQLFNETGVQEILNILAWYLNKNIILSNFDEDEIMVRINQFANVLTDFIFTNYEKFGLDNKEKIKHYPIVVLNIVNTVEAAYHRALHGGERTSLRTARTVHQSENPAGMGYQGMQPQQQKFSLVKPTTWGKI